MKNPLVSIIVTTKNEEKNIASCLQSIQKQTYRNIETIVVDNKSTDKTTDICKQFSVSVFDKGPERSAQRNYGARKSKGKYFLFLDADMVLEKDIVKECVLQITKNNQQKVYAIIVPEKSYGEGFWAKCKALERSFYEGVEWIEAARFFQEDIFWEFDGYDENLTGPEDFDLPQRIKTKYGKQFIGRINAYIHHNEGKLSLGKSLRKKYYYGKKMREYYASKKNRQYAKQQGSIFNRYILFFSKPKKLFQEPILGLGMLGMKTLEMVALGLGMIFNTKHILNNNL